VAAWLSETALRGSGSDASGFESHRKGKFFSKEGTSAGPWMCVCLSGADGRVVESDTLPTPPRGRQGSNPGRMGLPWMLCCIRVVSSRKEKGEERVGPQGT
jgi:hypothetical protein